MDDQYYDGMALPTRSLIDALQATADRLEQGARYAWTHMGACNCGSLAQTVSKLSAAEIHDIALQKRGNWQEQVMEHCPTSGLPMDMLINTLLELGLTRKDLADLERLSGPQVLRIVAEERKDEPGRILSHRSREDVVTYMRAFATYLERQRADAELLARSGSIRSENKMERKINELEALPSKLSV